MSKIFICYSHKDESFKDELQTHISVFEEDIESWSDRDIKSGEEWKDKILESINSCDSAIMIISTDFLASKFIKQIEMPTLLKRKEEEGVFVFPFILKPCNWLIVNENLSKIQARPKDGKPFSGFNRHQKDEILTSFIKEIREILISKNALSSLNNEEKHLIIKGSAYGKTTTTSNLSIQKTENDEPLLNLLYNYLKLKFDEIKVLPSYLFVNEFPFKGNSINSNYRSDFTLRLDNEPLLDLFKSFKIEDDKLLNNFGSSSDFEMAKYIINTLSQNHIFNIQGKSAGDFCKIRTINNKDINDPLNLYENFEYLKVLNSLPEVENDDVFENLKAGYFYYKIGDLLKSKEYFLKAKKIAEDKQKEVVLLICCHNLFHLGRLIEYRYWDLENKNVIVDELKEYKIENIQVSTTHKTLKDILLNRTFFTTPKQKIESYTKKVIDTYYNYLDRGRSSSNYEWEILYQYANLHAFLYKNYIIYDEYSDYSTLVHTLIESLFASYSIKNGKDKIISLDDYLISHIVLYASTDEIEKYYKRYYIDEINYVKTSKEKDGLISQLENCLLNDYDDLILLLNKIPDESRYRFWDKHDARLNNIIFLVSIIKLDENDVNKIAKSLIDYVSKNKTRFSNDRQQNKYIYQFFIRKTKYINLNSIKKLILFSMKNKDFYNDHYNLKICSKTSHLKKILSFTEIQFKNIVVPFIKNKLKIRTFSTYDDNAIYLYGALINEQQIFLKTLYLKTLNEKFDFNLYYLLVIYEIIDINYKDYFNLFINNIDISNEKVSNARNFFETPQFNKYSKLDILLNICFKYDIDLTDKRFSKFKDVNNYYKWLFNIDAYDYEDFDPFWINEYNTKYYYKHFCKSKILKKKINQYLVDEFDLRLEKIYNKVFYEFNQ